MPYACAAPVIIYLILTQTILSLPFFSVPLSLPSMIKSAPMQPSESHLLYSPTASYTLYTHCQKTSANRHTLHTRFECSLKIILTHHSITSIPPQTFQTSIRSILTRIEIFAVAFTARQSSVLLHVFCVAKKVAFIPFESGRALIPFCLLFRTRGFF